MIGGNDKITKGQNFSLIIASILGVGILSLPSQLAKSSGFNGIIAIIIGTIISIILVIMYTKLMIRFKSKTIFEVIDEILPQPIVKIIDILFIFHYLISGAIVVRIFGAIIRMFLLRNTPLEITILSLILVVCYITRKGIEPIARLSQIVLPLVIIPIFILFLSLIPELDFTNIYPIFPINAIEILKGIRTTLFSFIGIEIILISTAYVKNTNKILKYNILSIIFLGIMYLSTFIVVISEFGRKQTEDLLWPTLLLMKTVDVPGAFLENVDGIIIALWTFISVQILSILLIQSNILLNKSFKLKELDFLSMPLLPLIYLLALVPDNIDEVYYYIDLFSNYIGVVIILIIPLIIFIFVVITKKGGNKI
ncbi:GerAB/ArcD/ProY family transporter [Senegalia massiliensis]|uniref:GerAB/ArcD/ProY family transporter n=1 Tax=Senegalia massiliensis TaxID=1720316 RepID=UPI0013EF49C8|nr:endospore germination permease [Senegalia massiliensis]